MTLHTKHLTNRNILVGDFEKGGNVVFDTYSSNGQFFLAVNIVSIDLDLALYLGNLISL